MSGTVRVNLGGPIESVRLLDDFALSFEAAVVDKAAMKTAVVSAELMNRELEEKKEYLCGVCGTLERVAGELTGYYEKLFSGHKEEIAKLSVEIARRVLSQKVSEGDYRIETIVMEALENAPTKQNVVVYLNSSDLEACRKAFAESSTGAPAGVEFAADAGLGEAECRIKTDTGTVESLIDSHLEQICKALREAG